MPHHKGLFRSIRVGSLSDVGESKILLDRGCLQSDSYLVYVIGGAAVRRFSGKQSAVDITVQR
jgi:hypothetical protein